MCKLGKMKLDRRTACLSSRACPSIRGRALLLCLLSFIRLSLLGLLPLRCSDSEPRHKLRSSKDMLTSLTSVHRRFHVSSGGAPFFMPCSFVQLYQQTPANAMP